MDKAYYFPHDYNARNDPKLQEVLIEHGALGLGVFWCIVEQLYEQGGRLTLKSCRSIAFALHVDYEVVKSIVRDFGLFECDDVCFWSNSVLSRLERRKEVSEKRKKAAEVRWASSNPQEGQDKPRRTVGSKLFTPPTLEEVKAYMAEIGTLQEADPFVDYYSSIDWLVKDKKMKDWRASARNWVRWKKSKEGEKAKSQSPKPRKSNNGLIGSNAIPVDPEKIPTGSW